MIPKSEFPRGAERSPSARLITVQHAAEYLAVSVSTLYGWVYQRRIPFVKVGRALRFDISDLDRFIESNRIRPKAC
jgi:excisionase family DNA binding protein